MSVPIHSTVQKAHVRAFLAATAVVFLVAVVGRPMIDPSCLGHHTELSGAGFESPPGSRALSAPPVGILEADAGHPTHDTALVQACLCWFAGLAVSPPSFDLAMAVPPVRAAPAGPKVVVLRPVPFALPFANGPPTVA
jgi:hypothetical protein